MVLQSNRPVIIATRGSALALAQAQMVQAQLRRVLSSREFELRIFKTSGDQLQSASLSQADLPKGLFTKELEVALMSGDADLAVHSLKDLPTTLPVGLRLGAVGEREDPRDVLVYRSAETQVGRGFTAGIVLRELPAAATLATSSTRRAAQAREQHPQLTVVPIRGNVGTRLRKVAEDSGFDATLLAAAGLHRLGIRVDPDGCLTTNPAKGRDPLPSGLLATVLSPDEMLPCVGQGALGIEIRDGDPLGEEISTALNHLDTQVCVTAERAFLHAMGGGCQAAVAGYADLTGQGLRLRAVSYLGGTPKRCEVSGLPSQAVELGQRAAQRLTALG